MNALGLLLLLLISQSCFAQLKVTKVDKNSISKSVHYSGLLLEAVRWTDIFGDNLVITSETDKTPGKSKDNNGLVNAALYAYHYILSGDSCKLT
jgi:hypothetical protein